MSVLEIVFVGQCEVFVWLGFVKPFFTLFLFPLAAKLIGPRTGCQFLKNVDFSRIDPLKETLNNCRFFIRMKQENRGVHLVRESVCALLVGGCCLQCYVAILFKMQ